MVLHNGRVVVPDKMRRDGRPLSTPCAVLGSGDPEDRKKRRDLAERAKEYHDRKAHDLKPLSVGDHVLVQSQTTNKWDRRATVTAHRNDRSYDLLMENGSRSNRNRRFLRPDLTQSVPEKKREEKQEVEEPRRSIRKRKKTKRFQM